MQRQFDESCWEQWLRFVFHILLRSLSVAYSKDEKSFCMTNQNYKSTQQHRYDHNNYNPLIIECLTLPCLRIINQISKWTSNMPYLTNLITTTKSQKILTNLSV